MLVNFKSVSKRLDIRKKSNKDGAGLPTDQKHKHRRHFYRFKPYPQRHRFPITYNSTVGSIDMSQYASYAIHVFLHGLDYTIQNHLDPVENSCNYILKSYKNGKMQMECITKLTLMVCIYLLIF